jgi:hypothetical protein
MRIPLEIRKLALSLAVLSTLLLPALSTAPARAQPNFHSWVSHAGSNMNSCLMTSPCQTLAFALNQTKDGGEVSCLDSGSFDPFTVTISVTIDCNGTVASPNPYLPVSCVDVITINAPGKVVTLRGLAVTGLSFVSPMESSSWPRRRSTSKTA